jgi:hypothetical protein
MKKSEVASTSFRPQPHLQRRTLSVIFFLLHHQLHRPVAADGGRYVVAEALTVLA